MRRKKIGTMDFHGSVDITDPCYNRDVWCRMTDVKIRNGVYTCIAWHQKDKGTFDNGEPYCYDVIGIIGIYLDGVIPCQKEMKEIGTGSTQLLSTECMNCTFTGCFVGLTAQGDCEAKYRYFDVSVPANE